MNVFGLNNRKVAKVCLSEIFRHIFIETKVTRYFLMMVALFVDAHGGHLIANPCNFERYHLVRVILLMVEVDNAEGASSQFCIMEVSLVIVEDLGLKGLRVVV